MANNTADFVAENSFTVGTGDVSLDGALPSYARVLGSIPAGKCWYAISDENGNRESGEGNYNGGSVLARTIPHTTLVGGVVNNSNPPPISLSGASVVSIVFTAQAYQLMISEVESLRILANANAVGVSDNLDSINNQGVRVDDLEGDVSSISILVDANTGGVSDNSASLVALDTDVSYRETAITALESGGGLVGNGATVITIAAGNGEIIDSFTDTEIQDTKEVYWNEIQFDLLANGGMPEAVGLGYTDIAIQRTSVGDGVGSAVAIPNGLSSAQRKSMIKLGWVEYKDKVITNVKVSPIISNQVGNTLLDIIQFMDNDKQLKGFIVRPTELGDLSIWRDSGQIFSIGINFENNRADQNILDVLAIGGVDDPITLTPVIYDAGNGTAGTDITVISDTEYEPDPVGGTGLLNISNGKAVIHYILQSLGGTKVMCYAQKQYDSYDEAKANLYSDRSTHLFPAEVSTYILLAQVVVLKGAGVWGATAEIYPMGSAVSSGNGGGSATSALDISYSDIYNLGTNVQNALDSLAALKMTADQNDAMAGSNAPSASNVFATINDVPTEDYIDLRVPKTGILNTDNWDGVAYVDPLAIGGNPTAKIYPDGSIVGKTDNGSYTRYPNGDLTMALAGFTGYIAQETSSHLTPIASIGFLNSSCSVAPYTGYDFEFATYTTGGTEVYFISLINGVTNRVDIYATGRWKA